MNIDLNTLLDILKVAVGLIYLYLEYYARPSMWVASIIMPAIGLWLFWNKGLYADCAINVYYLLIAIYGFVVWTRHTRGSKDKTALQVSHVRPAVAFILLGCFVALWMCIAWLLHRFTDSTVVWLDSFTTALSVIGMWMLARKYLEQWLVWFVVDGVYVWLYYRKGIYFSGTLYAFYTVMAIAGYRRWRRQMEITKPDNLS